MGPVCLPRRGFTLIELVVSIVALYNAIGTQGPTDQNGSKVVNGDLDSYEVSVSVGDGAADCQDGSPQRIEVTVTHTSDRVNYELVSQRADY